jgi:uncharacterized protein (DUF427 family)
MHSRALPIKPGQESVWDYPRPPRLERLEKPVQIVFAGVSIVDAPWCHRVLETSHPPVYYIAPEHILPGVLMQVPGSSFCEWKGNASYYDVTAGGRRAERAAWTYLKPSAGFADICGAVAFYAQAMSRCTVDGEVVTPQPGGFYGGWITSDIVGPFKGEPGTNFW